MAVYASMVAKNAGVLLPLTHVRYAAFFLRDVKEIAAAGYIATMFAFHSTWE